MNTFNNSVATMKRGPLWAHLYQEDKQGAGDGRDFPILWPQTWSRTEQTILSLCLGIQAFDQEFSRCISTKHNIPAAANNDNRSSKVYILIILLYALRTHSIHSFIRTSEVCIGWQNKFLCNTKAIGELFKSLSSTKESTFPEGHLEAYLISIEPT